MGRKNSNARRRYNGASYGSFEELKNSGVRFDLSNGDFIGRKTAPHSGTLSKADISIYWAKGDVYLGISIKDPFGEKIGEFIKIGIVRHGIMERLYFMNDPECGYKLGKTQEHCRRRYIRVPIEEAQKAYYDRYCGNHDLKYDSDNSAYYVTPQ